MGNHGGGRRENKVGFDPERCSELLPKHEAAPPPGRAENPPPPRKDRRHPQPAADCIFNTGASGMYAAL